MNAIDMLRGQHRAVEKLFRQMDKARGPAERRRVFARIADALAVHATIEERHFYPAVREQRTDETLLESLEEHLAIKRVIADLLALDAGDETFEAKAKVLEDEVQHHVEEEEEVLFPEVEKLFDDDLLEAVAEEMARTQEELLESGHPRDAVPSETERAAQI